MKLDRYRIDPDDRGAFTRIDPEDSGPFKDKAAAVARLQSGVERLALLQERLYASDRYALLLIFQGMDAAGKDSAIKHVLSGVNPQSTEVHSFKVPSHEELAHSFLWRAAKALPARGRLGIFNRSYYEDVVVVRVHPELLGARRLADDLLTRKVWKHRYEDIASFEKHLVRNGTVIRKFYLHVSKEEQTRRLLARLEERDKLWKFSLADMEERKYWKDYRRAWTDAIAATSRDDAPWYIVPADHKWFSRVVIAEVILEALDSLDLSLPKPDAKTRKELASARALLKKNL